MIRNRGENQRFMNPDRMNFAPLEPPIYTPPNQLDPKDERLLEYAQEIGRIYGMNDLFQEDNARLEQENQELRDKNKQLTNRNESLESTESEERGASKLIKDIERELNNRKITKEK